MRIELIGPLGVTGAGGEALRLPGPRPSALLAMLVLAPGGRVPRATLADRFWGDRPEAQAGGALRQTLYALRQALGAEGARIGGREGMVTFDLAGVSLDLLDLRARPAGFGAAERRRLVALSRRELLEGLALSAQGAEDWLRAVREDWRTEIAGLLRASAEAAFAARDWTAARELAEGLHALDPFCEATMAMLLRLDAARAGPGAARRRFQGFAAGFRAELGLPPPQALAELVATLAEEPRAAAAASAAEAAAVGLLWSLGEGEAAGASAAARTVLAEELGLQGFRVFVEAPEDRLPVAAYLVRGGLAAFARDRALLLEVLSPARELLLARRLALRWPMGLETFEAEVAAEARAIGRRIAAHAGGTAPDLPEARVPLHGAILAAMATLPGTAAAAPAEEPGGASAAAAAAAPADPVGTRPAEATGEAVPPGAPLSPDPAAGPAGLRVAGPAPASAPEATTATAAPLLAGEADLFRFCAGEASPLRDARPAGAALFTVPAGAYVVAGLEVAWGPGAALAPARLPEAPAAAATPALGPDVPEPPGPELPEAPFREDGLPLGGTVEPALPQPLPHRPAALEPQGHWSPAERGLADWGPGDWRVRPELLHVLDLAA